MYEKVELKATRQCFFVFSDYLKASPALKELDVIPVTT